MPFLVGLDLGQAQDFSALAVVEQSTNVSCDCGDFPPSRVVLADRFCTRCKKTRGRTYAVRWMKRWQNGTPYPQIRRDVKAILERPPLHEGSELVVDYTGVGRSVVDEFREADLPAQIMPITITAGMAESRQKDGWHVAKKHIAGTLQILLQSERLKVSDLKERKILLQEMRAFRVKVNKETGNESFEAWRERDHDDMVLSVALPCWYGERGGFRKHPLASVQFHNVGGTPRPKGFRVVVCSFDELPRVFTEERALLITVEDRLIGEGVMSNAERGVRGPERRLPEEGNVDRGVVGPDHALQKLVDRLALRFNDVDPADHRSTWDDPVQPWGLPARDLCIQKDDARRLWAFLLKKRSPGPECFVFVGDRRAKTLAYVVCDLLGLKRSDNRPGERSGRPIWTPNDQDGERHGGEPPCRHLAETVRASRHQAIG